MTGLADGEDTIEELARWFLLSVCRHLEQEHWLTAEACELPDQALDELVSSYLADRSARQSLIMVLKDSRYRYRLIRFGSSRDHGQLQLSDSTIAFRRAKALLQPLLGERVPDADKALADPVPATASARRAARRAQPVASQGRARSSVAQEAADDAMSDEEYARLEQALSAAPIGDEPGPRRYGNNEDRLSLLYGLLSGALFVILVYWFFL